MTSLLACEFLEAPESCACLESLSTKAVDWHSGESGLEIKTVSVLPSKKEKKTRSPASLPSRPSTRSTKGEQPNDSRNEKQPPEQVIFTSNRTERSPPRESRPAHLLSLFHESRYLFSKLEAGIEQDQITRSLQQLDLKYDDDGEENFWIQSQLGINSIGEDQEKKKTAIAQVVSTIKSTLGAAITHGTNEEESTGQRPHTPVQPSSSPYFTTPSSREARKRKLSDRFDKNDQNDENDSDSEGDDRKPQKLTKSSPRRNPRFACPFFKHSPQKYLHERTCSGPGWASVHRVKEHLFRRHKLPQFRCTRCTWEFGSSKELNLHQRATQPCELRQEAPLEGVSPLQEAQLKSRKKEFTSIPETEKWTNVYSILFPKVNRSDIPTPFYEYAEMTNHESSRKQGLSDLEQMVDLASYEAYLEAELPPALHQELERDLEWELNISDQETKDRAIKLVRGLQPKLLRSFLERQPNWQPGSQTRFPLSPVTLQESAASANSSRRRSALLLKADDYDELRPAELSLVHEDLAALPWGYLYDQSVLDLSTHDHISQPIGSIDAQGDIGGYDGLGSYFQSDPNGGVVGSALAVVGGNWRDTFPTFPDVMEFD
ncbi:hypothetical protein F5Y19DRAFT_246513 [Xylariaceae sp. FL1651]|nr:hypothetical protein F5Y19DRAFT_246513 [Xylariaceae sp. FL1651]